VGWLVSDEARFESLLVVQLYVTSPRTFSFVVPYCALLISISSLFLTPNSFLFLALPTTITFR